jgi:hypothetical protein
MIREKNKVKGSAGMKSKLEFLIEIGDVVDVTSGGAVVGIFEGTNGRDLQEWCVSPSHVPANSLAQAHNKSFASAGLCAGRPACGTTSLSTLHGQCPSRPHIQGQQ